MKTTIIILASIFLLAGLLVALAFGFSAMLYRIFGRKSGLNQLAKRYPAHSHPEAPIFRKQKIAVGNVYYRNSADLSVTSAGLYLKVHPFLSKYNPVFIPWSAFNNPGRAILALRSAVRLFVGDPPITKIVFTKQIFEKIKPYLNV